MEVNKDEAERCIDIALFSMKIGNIERSEKFVRKAINLYPTQRAKDLLENINRIKTSSSNAKTSAENVRKRKQTGGSDGGGNGGGKDDSGGGGGGESHPIDYTKEQIEMVNRIKRCKDYYEVLNVTKQSTDSEIKKSYKRLALQLHPDKNRAPGAVEAFKAVGNAVAVLTDTQKRKAYDLYGADGEKSSFMRRSNNNNNYHQSSTTTNYEDNTNYEYEHAYGRGGGGFESDFSAEELFHMFFGGGFPQQRQQQRQRYQNQRQDLPQNPSLAFGLILVLIVISMLSSFFTSDPVYSLASSTKYPVRRNTIHLNIPYYVKEKFDMEYQGTLARLENSVEEDYITLMKQACYRERSYREMMILRAKSFSSRVHLEQAKNLKSPSCENLAKIGLTKYLP